jgi:hypothetical protein
MLEYVPLVGGALLRAARGGAEIGPATLARFFVLHVALLPVAMLLLLAFHFWLVRKVGGVILPEDAGDAAAPRGPLVATSPALTQREWTASRVVLAAVLLLAAVAEAPLLAPANPGLSPNPAKAPWYFMGVQELLVHLHPAFGAVVVPALVFALLVALPALGGGERPSGRWFGSPRGARFSTLAAALGAGLTALAVVVDEPLRRVPTRWPWLPAAARGGLLPLGVAALLVVLAAWGARRRGASRQEAVMAAFAMVLASAATLTVVGVLLRGPGMALVLP